MKEHKISKFPKDCIFTYRPTLMQLYVAYKVNTNQYFGNFSGTGAGKILSAVLVNRVIHSKMTLIICPNDVVAQWKKVSWRYHPIWRLQQERSILSKK